MADDQQSEARRSHLCKGASEFFSLVDIILLDFSHSHLTRLMALLTEPDFSAITTDEFA